MQKIQLLRNRVEELEKIVGNQDQDFQSQITQIEGRIKKKLTIDLQRQLSQISQFTDNFNEIQKQTDLSIQEKVTILLTYQGQIQKMYNQLQELKELQQYSDIQPLLDLQEKQKQVDSLNLMIKVEKNQQKEQQELEKLNQIQISQAFQKVNKNLVEEIIRQNQTFDEINKKFLQLAKQ